MVGALNSIIGAEPDDVMVRFLNQTPQRLRIVTKGPVRFNSVMIDIDDSTGKTRDISRVDRYIS